MAVEDIAPSHLARHCDMSMVLWAMLGNQLLQAAITM